jgi:hypothetical protein
VSDTARTVTAVTLLADDSPARKLVVSWPLVPKELTGRPALVEWARLAGVALAHAERLSYVLFRHDVCREDRTVDPDAMKVVSHFAVETLRAAKRSGR